MFRRRFDGRIQRELSREIAQLKSRVRCEDFPTDVAAIAAEVGIRQIRRVPLSMRGRLVRAMPGYMVEINEELDVHDQRFVLAHEITHVLLNDQMSSAAARFGYNRIERLCDFGATEILLPLSA